MSEKQGADHQAPARCTLTQDHVSYIAQMYVRGFNLFQIADKLEVAPDELEECVFEYGELFDQATGRALKSVVYGFEVRMIEHLMELAESDRPRIKLDAIGKLMQIIRNYREEDALEEKAAAEAKATPTENRPGQAGAPSAKTVPPRPTKKAYSPWIWDLTHQMDHDDIKRERERRRVEADRRNLNRSASQHNPVTTSTASASTSASTQSAVGGPSTGTKA